MTSKSGELIVAPDAGIEYNLDKFPEAGFNRLIPTQTIRVPTDLMVPVVQIVALNIAEDTYEGKDIPQGRRALGRVGLRKLSTAGGVNIIGEERVDDGSKPGTCGVRITAEMTLPTGQRLRATGTKWVDVERMSWSSAAQRGKFLAFLYEHTASRAENRAIRALLSLRSSYTVTDLAKPFAVVSFAPNMNHPEVRARILEAMAPSVAQLYGPSAPAQLGAGATVVVIPEAPEDEAPAAGTSADPGPTEPGWFSATATATAQPAENRLAVVLRQKATSSGLVGPATPPQMAKLREIFTPIGREPTAAGMAIVFGLVQPVDVTAGQAQALIETSVDATFADLWREMVAEGREAAA